MIRSIVLAVLAFAPAFLGVGCAAAGEAKPPQGTGEVRVMTYNIHHAEGSDGRLDVARIAGVIQGESPDLVAVQEVDVKTARTGGIDEAAELGRLTGMHYVFGKAMDYQGGAYGQVILSRWPIVGHEVHVLPESAGKEPRIAVEARVKTPGGRAIRFVGTHLDHVRDDKDRVEQAKRLNELFAGEGAGRTIVAGDLNAVEESRPMQVLLEQWSDARVAGKQQGATIPATNPTKKIDWILVAKGAGWEVVETRVVPEGVASDHRPVVATLRKKDE